MNILENISFSSEKANVCIIKKNDRLKYFAVALGNGAVMKKHTTSFPATLIVLKGEINFIYEDRQITLREMDTFEIPVNIVHEVVGISDQNLFLVTQEL